MSQMRLFDMAHYAEMLERMEHKVDCLNRKMDALLAIKTDDQPTLLAMVAAGPALEVVPNEDEAMPVAEPVIVQDEPSPRKRKKEPLPFHIADIGSQSRDFRKQSDLLFKKAAEAAPKHQPELLRQAASAAEKSAELLSEYDRQRGEYRPRIDNRTSRKPKPGKGNK
jgi:hypothetical protein